MTTRDCAATSSGISQRPLKILSTDSPRRSRSAVCHGHCLTDNGSAMVAEEVTEGLMRLGILHERTLPYSPYQNGKQEAFWGTLEGRLMRMLDGTAQLTLEFLNQATQAWVEIEYHRSVHRETSSSPVDRFAQTLHVLRPSPSSESLRDAFRLETTRRQRQSDGTISLEGVRLRFRHGIATSVKSPCATHAGTSAASTWSTRAAERFWLPFFLSTKAPTLTAAAHSSSSNPRTRCLLDPKPVSCRRS